VTKAPNPPRSKPGQDDGGPAYPSQHVDSSGHPQQPSDGISKREAYAMAALTGLCSNPTNTETVRGLSHFPTFAAAWALPHG
jgi:hypothetical protein